jgi:hypothetical protein
MSVRLKREKFTVIPSFIDVPPFEKEVFTVNNKEEFREFENIIKKSKCFDVDLLEVGGDYIIVRAMCLKGDITGKITVDREFAYNLLQRDEKKGTTFGEIINHVPSDSE